LLLDIRLYYISGCFLLRHTTLNFPFPTFKKVILIDRFGMVIFDLKAKLVEPLTGMGDPEAASGFFGSLAYNAEDIPNRKDQRCPKRT
jgi:hypothetical protein